MGPGLTQGFFGYRDYDLEKVPVPVLWGTDPLASNRMVPNTIRRFGEILDRGTVIAVDPRCPSRCQGAEWLPVNPAPTARWPARLRTCCWSRACEPRFVATFKDGRNLFAAGQAVDEAAFARRRLGLVKCGPRAQGPHAGLAAKKR